MSVFMGNVDSAFNSFGVGMYGDQTIPCINSCGTLNLQGTTVSGKTEVKGALTAKGAHLNILDVQGSANIDQTTIESNTYIQGLIVANRTSFLGSVVLTTCSYYQSTFNNSTIKEITVEKSLEGREIIHLNGDTIVQGNIVFKSGHGLVNIQSGCQILGQVIGATIQQQ